MTVDNIKTISKQVQDAKDLLDSFTGDIKSISEACYILQVVIGALAYEANKLELPYTPKYNDMAEAFLDYFDEEE
jgi:hypothetical protein